mgnify:CR=1 FL=1
MNPCGVFDRSYSEDMAIVRTRFQWGALAAFIIFFYSLPLFAPAQILSFISLTAITLIVVLGLYVLTGLCGQISVGQAAFMAVGAYTSTILIAKVGLPFLVSLVCAGLVAGLIGLIFGLPSLKVKGFYLVVATIGAQYIIMWIIMHTPSLTGGPMGMITPPAAIGAMVFQSERSCFFLIVTICALLLCFAKNLARTRIGRAFIAIRDNDLAAEVLGVNVFGYKLLAFFICSFYAGIGGSLFAHYTLRVTSEWFTLWDSIWYLGMLIVGGMGGIMGAIYGTVVMKGLKEVLSVVGIRVGPLIGPYIAANLVPIVTSLVIMAFLLFEPRGINHRWEVFKASYRRWPFPY